LSSVITSVFEGPNVHRHRHVINRVPLQGNIPFEPPCYLPTKPDTVLYGWQPVLLPRCFWLLSVRAALMRKRLKAMLARDKFRKTIGHSYTGNCFMWKKRTMYYAHNSYVPSGGCRIQNRHRRHVKSTVQNSAWHKSQAT
jgi:hypothetical protein